MSKMSAYNSNVNDSNNITRSTDPKQTNNEEEDEEQLIKQALVIARGISFPMALKAAIELNILNLISDATLKGSYLSASELAGMIPGCFNPNAPALLDRMLSLLSSFSILKCEVIQNGEGGGGGGVERVYAAAPICKYFLISKEEDVKLQGSFGPLFLLHHDRVILDAWYHFKDALLEGGATPLVRAHEKNLFEYAPTDPRFNKVFNGAMSNHTTLVTKKILDVYRGFEGIGVLVDVGGGIGTTLGLITDRYDNIKGINFDLPQVIAHSILNPRVENVGGNMFEKVPNGDAIFMKWILHDWDDERCVKLLRNCWEAVPERGKVIVVESVVSGPPESSYESQIVGEQDVAMFVHNDGGKERTAHEFNALASQSGFPGFRLLCSVYNTWVMEFHKH